MAKFLNHLISYSRSFKIALQLTADTVSIITAFCIALFLRFDEISLISQTKTWIVLLPAVITALLTFRYVGLYQILIRFLTGKIVILILKGVSASTAVFYFLAITLKMEWPNSLPLIFFITSFISLTSIRFLIRAVLRKPTHAINKPIIIYGAGAAGRQVLNLLFYSFEYTPVALIDDDPALIGMKVSGLKVYSPNQIMEVVKDKGVHSILLAMPSLGRKRLNEIITLLENQKLTIQTIPNPSDLISGKRKISDLDLISIEDVLGRDPVRPNDEILSKDIYNQSIMVTGAGGSIGSELCRQILSLRPSRLILYEISELALYQIEKELNQITKVNGIEVEIIAVLGSVQSKTRLEATFAAYKVQMVYHTAAFKHVPMVEENVIEAILNNVFGTWEVSNAAIKFSVKKFILISTDKAVRPTNIMGATKRLAELICQAHAACGSATIFSIVRFGNLLGSSGSVLPLFRSQIQSGGPVTVTHENITRFFMTITEASQLVIQAGSMSKGGEVFILDMGEPVRILDLAMRMIKLSGFQPIMETERAKLDRGSDDITIKITGLRKGEKMYEELVIGNNTQKTIHPRIMAATENLISKDELKKNLDQLNQACASNDISHAIAILRELPIQYKQNL